MNIPYFRPSIGREEKAAVDQVLSSGWLTSGRAVKDFEHEFASFLGAEHAVAVNSCTAALHLALESAGVGPGDVVLVPTLTFAATAAAVRYLGARPVLVDSEPTTLCIDPEDVERQAAKWSHLGPLKATLTVHYGGQMADIDSLHAVANHWGMTLIEDAAHALPSYTRSRASAPWRSVGTTSTLTCFSFYANKCITTGEGGMAVTNDPALAERMRMMSLHGLSRSAWNRFSTRGSWQYEIEELGFKYNMTDVAAAIGREQLKKADEFEQGRRAVAERYKERLAEFDEFLELPTELPNRRSSWHIYPLRLRIEALRVDRSEFIAELADRGVSCSVHWMPLHLHPNYQAKFGCQPNDHPVANAEWQRLASLPIFPGMTLEEADFVCDAVVAVVTNKKEPFLGKQPVATVQRERLPTLAGS